MASQRHALQDNNAASFWAAKSLSPRRCIPHDLQPRPLMRSPTASLFKSPRSGIVSPRTLLSHTATGTASALASRRCALEAFSHSGGYNGTGTSTVHSRRVRKRQASQTDERCADNGLPSRQGDTPCFASTASSSQRRPHKAANKLGCPTSSNYAMRAGTCHCY